MSRCGWMLLGVAAAGTPLAPARGQDITAADRAFIAHDLGAAARLYRDVAESSAPARDRGRALRRLSALAWRFRGDVGEARGHLAAALRLGVDSSETFAERARLEAHAGRLEGAMAAARAALRAAERDVERATAVTRLADAAVTVATRDLLDRGHWPGDSVRDALSEALTHVRSLVRETPGLIDPSSLLLSVALLLDDGAAALEAWRSYYLLHVERPGPLPAAWQTLQEALPRWVGPATSAADRRAVIEALAASAFFGPALILIADPRVSREPLRVTGDIALYGRFLRAAERIADEYYRLTALDSGDADAFRQLLIGEARALWPQLSWEGDVPPFEVENFEPEMRRRFRAEINLGTTAGYFDLHYGHRVIDEPRVIEQYDHVAEVRFVALDGMQSNGFQSWAWDGEQAHGGWANDSVIFQVRPGYADGPLRVWQALTDSTDLAERQERQRTDSLADLARARDDPYAYLPGLRSRMFGRGLVALRDSLMALGLAGGELRAAFLAEYDRAHVGSSIFAHEGRHAIDRRLDLELDVWEREFRAKLSEVAFAPRPRLALGGIINRNIGDDTPHGRANLEIMRGLVRWMREHTAGIIGVDTDAPLLLQLSLLTDRQLRDAFASMDPLARRAR